MKKVIGLIIIAALLSSCATILTKKEYPLTLSSNILDAKVEISDSVYSLPTRLVVTRSKEDMHIKLIKDTLSKDFTLKSAPNAAFLYANILLPPAYLVDLTNQKRFYYGKYVIINAFDSSGIIRPNTTKRYHDYFSKNYPTNKGDLNLTFSLPWVNNFYMQPMGESAKTNTGFWGISAGLEYYYKKNKYLALSGSGVMDYFLPVPYPADVKNSTELMTSVYFGITDNIKLNQFTFGYGLNYSINSWNYKYIDNTTIPATIIKEVNKTSNSLGLTVDAYHQFKKNMFIGIIYRPTFMTVSPETDYKYEHIVSLDFKWKFSLKKRYIDEKMN